SSGVGCTYGPYQSRHHCNALPYISSNPSGVRCIALGGSTGNVESNVSAFEEPNGRLTLGSPSPHGYTRLLPPRRPAPVPAAAYSHAASVGRLAPSHAA